MPALGLDPDPDVRSAARKFILNADGLQPTVCMVVLGELTHKGCEADPLAFAEAMAKLHEWVRDGTLARFGIGDAGGEVHRHARAMQERDYKLTPADAAIIASMICDEGADILVSMDRFTYWTDVRDYVREQDRDLKPLTNNGHERKRAIGGNRRSQGR